MKLKCTFFFICCYELSLLEEKRSIRVYQRILFYFFEDTEDSSGEHTWKRELSYQLPFIIHNKSMGVIEILLPFSALCFEAFLHLYKFMYSKMYSNLFWLKTKIEHHYHNKIYEIFHVNDTD